MKITEGPMLFEIIHLPTEEDVIEEFEKLKSLLAGRRMKAELQSYIFSELIYAICKKVEVSSTRLQEG